MNTDLEKRVIISQSIRERYPDRVPLICEPADGCDVTLDRIRFLVPSDFKIGHFMFTLRKRCKNISSKDALYLFTDNEKIPSTNQNFGEIYERFKDEEDGLLYFRFAKEKTFG